MTIEYTEKHIANHQPFQVGTFTVRVTSDTLDDPTPYRWDEELYFPNMVIKLNDHELGYIRYLFLHIEGASRDHPLVEREHVHVPEVDINWLGRKILPFINIMQTDEESFEYHSAIATLGVIPTEDYLGSGTCTMPFLDIMEIAKGVYLCSNPFEDEQQREALQIKYREDDVDGGDHGNVHIRYYHLYTIYDQLGWDSIGLADLAISQAESDDIYDTLVDGFTVMFDEGAINPNKHAVEDTPSMSFEHLAVMTHLAFKSVEATINL